MHRGGDHRSARDLPLPQLPFSGESAYQRYHQSLSDRQLRMIDKLAEAAQDYQRLVPSVTVLDPLKRKVKAQQDEQSSTRNRELDLSLQAAQLRLEGSAGHRKMTEFRNSLPASQFKQKILSYSQDNQVFVVSGETGCGKTTQVPQYILDHAIQSGVGSSVRIVCTQPRRVAAISVAERVAAERSEKLGDTVGYQVRMDNKAPRSRGSILYCTSGILLQRIQSDRQLKQFSHVILDEVHERDVMTDIIMVLLKEVIHHRPDIKVLLMSATLNGAQFAAYFGGCPVLHIPGFMFPVMAYYLPEVLQQIDYEVKPPDGEGAYVLGDVYKELNHVLGELKGSGEPDALLRHSLLEELNLDIVAAVVRRIHEREGEGAVLVFLPGWEDICRLARILEDTFLLKDALILPLHGSMSPADQKLIFDKSPRGYRKVVIATNIAESSVTIDDVVYVIDCGRAKIKMFDPQRNVATLKPEWISQANAKQRKGRAGRVRPGQVYKLYTRDREESLADYMVPEMLRTRLESVILKVKVLGCSQLSEFLSLLLDPPSQLAVDLAVQALKDIGALNTLGQLTALGANLADLPVDPQLGKMMVMGCAFSCLEPILAVVTALDYKSPFHLTSKIKECNESHDVMANNTLSDHLAIANAVAGWDMARGADRGGPAAMDFCNNFFLSQKILLNMDKMKYQHTLELYRMQLLPSKDPKDPESNINSGVEAVVRAIIVLSLLPNMAVIQEKEDGYILTSCQEQLMEFHPRSCNRDLLDKMRSSSKACIMPRWFCYFEKMHTSDTFLHDTTAAGMMSLMLLASNIAFTPLHNPHMDKTIDVETKERLGVCFRNEEKHLVDIRMTAGGSRGLRLFVCEESVGQQIQLVRHVLDGVLQTRYLGEGRGSWDQKSPGGQLVALLLRVLAADRVDM